MENSSDRGNAVRVNVARPRTGRDERHRAARCHGRGSGEGGKPQEWTTRRERGAVARIRFIVWLALRLGRSAARMLLYPICAYFLIFSLRSRRASRDYLARVLGRKPGPADLFRHYHSFGASALDRVFLLNDQIDRFDIRVHGEEIVLDILRQGSGCILLGAHFGSFEGGRAVGRMQPALRVSLGMNEEN